MKLLALNYYLIRFLNKTLMAWIDCIFKSNNFSTFFPYLVQLSRTHFLLPHVVYKLRISYFGGINHQSSHDRWSASIYNRFVKKQCTENADGRIFFLFVVWLHAGVEIANLTVSISAGHLSKFYFQKLSSSLFDNYTNSIEIIAWSGAPKNRFGF